MWRDEHADVALESGPPHVRRPAPPGADITLDNPLYQLDSRRDAGGEDVNRDPAQAAPGGSRPCSSSSDRSLRPVSLERRW